MQVRSNSRRAGGKLAAEAVQDGAGGANGAAVETGVGAGVGGEGGRGEEGGKSAPGVASGGFKAGGVEADEEGIEVTAPEGEVDMTGDESPESGVGNSG